MPMVGCWRAKGSFARAATRQEYSTVGTHHKTCSHIGSSDATIPFLRYWVAWRIDTFVQVKVFDRQLSSASTGAMLGGTNTSPGTCWSILYVTTRRCAIGKRDDNHAEDVKARIW